MPEKEGKEVIIIAGIAKNNVIGSKNQLPWHISEDLKHFKELTFGNPAIMGRNTYESILQTLGKPLPGRKNIVVTSQKDYDTNPETIIAHSLKEAIEKGKQIGEKVYIIGGEKVYQQALPLADKLEITHIHKSFSGDSYFPEISGQDWLEIKREDKKGENLDFSFSTYERKSPALKPNKRGIFIAFEGIDGCGKSTQIRKLTHHIFEKNKHFHIVLTRNPYKNADIRKILTEDSDPYSQAEKLANLYIDDRKMHADELVKPNLEKGYFVLTDRYKLSTISYQAAQGLLMEDLIKRQEELPTPDMTFIVDVSPEVAKQRMQKEDISIRGKEHKFEANLEFAKKLRENYLKSAELMRARGEKVFVINGERTPDEIFSEIKGIFDRLTGQQK